MPLIHEFCLVERGVALGTQGEVASAPEVNALLHDDFYQYMWFSLRWIQYHSGHPTGPLHMGLNTWGLSYIGEEGAPMMQRVFRDWSALFSLGPDPLSLTRGYVHDHDVELSELSQSRPIKEMKWTASKEVLCQSLESIADHAAVAARGQHYVLHRGI